MGANTITTMMRAGRFRVDDACIVLMVAATLAPFLRNADEMGTMHAEQSVIGAPMAIPLRADRNPAPRALGKRVWGKMKVSVRPAARKAKTMPMDTICK